MAKRVFKRFASVLTKPRRSQSGQYALHPTVGCSCLCCLTGGVILMVARPPLLAGALPLCTAVLPGTRAFVTILSRRHHAFANLEGWTSAPSATARASAYWPIRSPPCHWLSLPLAVLDLGSTLSVFRAEATGWCSRSHTSLCRLALSLAVPP